MEHAIPFYHEECGGVAIFTQSERPDPDHHGNTSHSIECAVCGKTGSLLHNTRNGGLEPSKGFEEI